MFLCHLLGEEKMPKQIGHLKTTINFLHLQVRQKTVLVENYSCMKKITCIYKVQCILNAMTNSLSFWATNGSGNPALQKY